MAGLLVLLQCLTDNADTDIFAGYTLVSPKTDLPGERLHASAESFLVGFCLGRQFVAQAGFELDM